jgi:hypothetical protein
LAPPFLPLSLWISLNRLVPIAARGIDGRTSNQGRVRAPGDAGAMGAGVGLIEVPQRRPPEHDPVRGALPGAEAGSTHAELRREPPSLIPLRSGEPQTIHQVCRPDPGVSPAGEPPPPAPAPGRVGGVARPGGPGAPARLLGGEPLRPRRHDPGGARPGRTAPRGAVRRHRGTARRPQPHRHRQPERLGLRPIPEHGLRHLRTARALLRRDRACARGHTAAGSAFYRPTGDFIAWDDRVARPRPRVRPRDAGPGSRSWSSPA